ncbi:uncharacterized protein EV422DRAFT_617152 [Fimicolochytrium jonesii]|uniref:uncharacterized protein n=1 Tax=Fimicolochytrium jonesii TaxID=1396493 RepID=UPI0022FF4225|nr:uncharacterized protein EV422DRAFT_617152 [Fimicolochytrium jonesii]KAI8826173.1 hypothetical protein EV422DRAFT_617152 [Fimicolochytrium jonesii]
MRTHLFLLALLAALVAVASADKIVFNGLDFDDGADDTTAVAVSARSDLATRAPGQCTIFTGFKCALEIAKAATCFAVTIMAAPVTFGAALAAFTACSSFGRTAVSTCKPCFDKLFAKLVALAHKHKKALPWEKNTPKKKLTIRAPTKESLVACLDDLVKSQGFEQDDAMRFCKLGGY